MNGPVVVGLIPVGAPVSAFANGSLPKLSKPASGDLHYAGVFSADDFVGNWTGKPLSTAISAFNSNKAYVSLRKRGIAPDAGWGLLRMGKPPPRRGRGERHAWILP